MHPIPRRLAPGLAPALFAVLAPAVPLAAQAPPPAPSRFDAMSWRCIGPFRGGRCTAVTGVRGNPLTYYFGSCGGGVWKTTDAGTTWNNVTDGFLKTGSVGAIAVAPSDHNVVYVGTGEAAVRGVTTSFGDGVYRSTDAGRTWRHLGLERTRQIAEIVVHPNDPDVVWVAAQGNPWKPTSERGVYRTLDGGETWERVLFVDESTGASGLSLDPANPRMLYAGMWDHRRLPWKVVSGGAGGGVHKTEDGGVTWEKLTEGLPDLIGKVDVAVSPANRERVWALVEADDGGLFRSDDAGETFERVNGERILRARAWYYTHLIADPVDADTVFVMNAPFLKSIDGGRTFARVATPHGDNHALWIDPDDPERMINGNDGGANISFNGGRTWSTQANQPTAQFYRVITDARFPYRVYGGQQDNSTVGIASRTSQDGIGREHWHPVGGGESAFVAFDPDDPRLVYAGVYQGIITEFDVVTKRARNVMADPFLGLGADPRDLPYRFNWNAPIVASPHDPKTIYHAGNVLLRTRDRGSSWDEISPDLTRDEIDKQGPGGGPITNEAAGGETYNTIQYVVESPHEAGTIWVGSDDGLVHLTRNGGETWAAVTPDGVGEAMINAIEVSPHDPAKALLAVTRYKSGDFTPHVFVTGDYGSSWERRVDGLPDDAFVRVVREDPEREGLLYAGTELGVFVSFDDGARWESLQLDLPIVPITDLTVRDGDLVAATQGRAFWILDDLSPLRQWRPELARTDLHLFEPRPVVRFAGGGWQEPPAGRGQNPPPAILYYAIGAALDLDADPVEIEILDQDDRVLRKLSSAAEPRPAGDGGRGAPLRVVLGTDRGLNRAAWDLRTDELTEIEGQRHFGSRRGYVVAPGEYRVRISCGERQSTRAFEVLPDPRLGIAREDWAEQQALARDLWGIADEIHRAVVRVRDVRGQVEELVDRHRDDREIAGAGDELVSGLTAWEERVLQTRQETQQDVINFPNRLGAFVLDLLAKIDGAGPPVTSGAARRADELRSEWRVRDAELRDLLERDVGAFNAMFDARRLPAVRVDSDR